MQSKKISQFEFVAMMAFLMALTALAIDAILPALDLIGAEYRVALKNETQYLISFLFYGMIIGQMLYGPLSDSYGRKKLIYIGITIFVIGNFISLFAPNFDIVLLGRFIQGLGVASTRVVSMAIIRDLYSGNAMAKVMSLINMVFILVPALAPSIGQLLLFKFDWHSIIILFIILSIAATVWMHFRLVETLPKEKRSNFSFARLKLAFKKTISTRLTMGYTIASGLIFGAFLGYLLSSQQIFVDIYQVGELFPLYFGSLALVIGVTSFINSRLVEKFGMRNLCFTALCLLFINSSLFVSLTYFYSGVIPLFIFMLLMMSIFSCVGILFGNFNSLAIEPLGDIAGMATAVISTLQNIVSISLASMIGANFNNTLYPMALGFLFLSTASLLSMIWTEGFNLKFHRPKKNL